MKAHFQTFTAYNAWANQRLYDAAGALHDESYRRDVGVFFASLHGTLNHILGTDRLWLARMTGEGSFPGSLDATLYDEFAELRAAREVEDARLAAHVDSLDEDAFEAPFDYKTLDGTAMRQLRRESLAHLFNHQTHHRSQAHTCLGLLGAEQPPLDLLAYQRST